MTDYFYFLLKILLTVAASRGSMRLLEVFLRRLRRQMFAVFLMFQTKPPAGRVHGGSMTDYFYFLFKILLTVAASRGSVSLFIDKSGENPDRLLLFFIFCAKIRRSPQR